MRKQATKLKKIIDDFFCKHDAIINSAEYDKIRGKLYELLCLSKTVKFLEKLFGAQVILENVDSNNFANFKSKPGKIDSKMSFFKVIIDNQYFELHTNIEFETHSSKFINNVTKIDHALYHEIDILLIEGECENGTRPEPEKIVLGIECKSGQHINKSTIREVIGLKNELSIFTESTTQYSKLKTRKGNKIPIKTIPPTLFWLVFRDRMGKRKYKNGPNLYGVRLMYWPSPKADALKS